MVHQRVVQLLHQVHPKRADLVVVLSNLLHLSERSIYSRLNGKTVFTVAEVALIVQHFKLDASEIFESISPVPSDPQQLYLSDFINDLMEHWVQEVERLLHRTNSKIYLTTNSLPFSLALKFPLLIKFRLYFIAKYLWKHPNEVFEPLDLASKMFDAVPNYCQRISEVYQQLPTTEIWGPSTFHTFLNQIMYLHRNAQIGHINDILLLLDELEQLVNLSKKYAKNGRKQEQTMLHLDSSIPKYTLFFNDIMNVNEYTFLTWQEDDRQESYIYHSVLGVLDNSIQKERVEKYILMLLKTGTSISASNRSIRNTFFRKVKTAILKYKKELMLPRVRSGYSLQLSK